MQEICGEKLITHYFFLYPVGHLGFTSETFFIALPLTHVIVIFFTTGLVVSDGLGDAVGATQILSVGSGKPLWPKDTTD